MDPVKDRGHGKQVKNESMCRKLITKCNYGERSTDRDLH